MNRKICCYILIYLISHAAQAGDWRVFTNLNVTETFSDNINLSQSGNERSAFVTEITPSISIRKPFGRTRLNLNYRLQGIYNAGGNEDFDLNHQLQFNSNTILRRNSLFLNLRSSISQQNLVNFRSANDNITGGQNRTTVYTYGASPFWTPRFGGYANGLLRFSFSGVDFSEEELPEDDLPPPGSGAPTEAPPPPSNSKIYEWNARLTSGWRFSRFGWSLNYNNREEDRSDGDDVKSENASGTIRVSFNRQSSVFAQGGYIDNQFETVTDINQNGFFYTVGARWRPSSRFILEGGYGNNSFASVTIWPTRYMQWVVTYRNNRIGTNTGNVWQGLFRYNTKRSVWSASYFEDTTTTQAVLSELRTFVVIDEFGNPIIDPASQQPIIFDISLPTLTDEVFIRKRADFRYSYRSGRSTYNLSMYGEKRDFQVQLNEEEVFGVTGTWNWRFTRNSSLLFRPSWQYLRRINPNEAGTDSSESNDNRVEAILSVNRNIPFKVGNRSTSRMNARLEYRFLKQISTIDVNEFTENRVTLSVFLRF